MFKNVDKEIKVIYELAKKKEEEYSANNSDGGIKTIGEKLDKIMESIKEGPTGAEKQLQDYMDKLDFETIKTIQVIMYIGRDGSDEIEPELIYKKQRDSFDQDGWNTKEIETQQILQKAPLHKYLLKGCEMLHIQL